MNSYEITFTRENGTTGSDRFTAPSEAQARRDFKEVYRHGEGTITSIELVSSDSPATKEQERKALEKIRKIVEELALAAISPPPSTAASRLRRRTLKTTLPTA